jgi:signal peptidase I
MIDTVAAGGPPPRLRQLLDTGVLTLVAILLASTWHARAFVVSGPSMAGTLLGQHHQVTCGVCGFVYPCDAEEPEMPGKRAVCPNCGNATRRLDTAPRWPADAVLVDRTAFCGRSPRRWELVVFRGVDRPSQTFVKRVAGLPGEAVELKHGDVYADGAIQRKTMVQQRAIAVPVYNSRCEPADGRSRWLPDAANSGWRQAGSRFWRAASSDSGDETIDWLTYHHRRSGSGTADRADENPITDDCGYNQASPVTESFFVHDLMVRGHLRAGDAATVSWLISDGRSQFSVDLDFSNGVASVIQDGRPLGEGSDFSHEDGEVLCELALCDQQVLLAIDEREVLRLPYEPPDLPFRPTSRPVAVGTRSAGLEIWDLVLLRDIYYRPPRSGTAQDRLGKDEYFVLGDNSPASLDSRSWSPPGIAADRLIGKPILAWPSGMRSVGPGRQFQVPAVSRLRYIR